MLLAFVLALALAFIIIIVIIIMYILVFIVHYYDYFMIIVIYTLYICPIPLQLHAWFFFRAGEAHWRPSTQPWRPPTLCFKMLQLGPQDQEHPT